MKQAFAVGGGIDIRKRQVGIIDYQMGNIFNVLRACEHVDLIPLLTSNKKELSDFDALILPGVGAFGIAMENLKRIDLIEAIKDFVSTGKPFMGICLGMQLLFSESEEFGLHKGLDIIKGKVKRFPSVDSYGRRVKVPQVGWNKLHLIGDQPVFENIENKAEMYFVHSYYVVPEEKQGLASITNYADVEFCSSFVSGNIMAFQFHPEKSAENGLQIFKNFAKKI